MKTILQKLITLSSLLALSMLFTACSLSPVKDIEGQAVPPYIHSSEQVKETIISAGKKLGWIFKETDSSNLEGALFTPKYVYRINIPYSSTEYSLQFVQIDKMRYDDGETKTYHKEKGWMEELNLAIQEKFK